MSRFTRSFPLEDVNVRSGGDGRTVEAYAAVFNQPANVNDSSGTYVEQIDPAAFNKTLRDKGTRFGVLFNHGMTIYGTPSDRGSMPIGTPLEVRADARGLFTVTRYNNTPLAEEALEAIKSGAIRSQSFQGRFIRSDKPTPRGGFRADSSGVLPLVTRQEIDLKEYGPATFAVYEEAAITGVRATITFSPAEQAVLSGLLTDLAAGDAVLDTITQQAAQLLGADQALDCALMYLSALLSKPNPDMPEADDASDGMDMLDQMGYGEERSAVLHRLKAIATRLETVPAVNTTPSGAGAVGSALAGSSRRTISTAYLSLRRQAREKGVL